MPTASGGNARPYKLPRGEWNSMSFITDSLILGIIQAAPLVLAAAGFTMIFYLNGFINVAYAENLTMGAYFAIIFNTMLKINFYVSIIPAALLTGITSVITYLLVFRVSIKRGVNSTEMIILSVGLSFFIRHLIHIIFGGVLRNFDVATPSSIKFLGIGVTTIQLMTIFLVIAAVVALYFLIYRTKYGEMMRALANNEDLAMASGINPNRVSILIWFIAGVLGGLSGVFYGVFSFVNPAVGWKLILIIIMISIVGGVGNVRGALMASVGAGVILASVTLLTTPIYGEIILLLAFIAVLQFRTVRS
jgi:branched-subunit amino acid ABC-type transport system permease component